jgi:hypothetical protein
MKPFLISLGLIAVISVAAALVLNAVDMSAQSVYSTAQTRF